MLGGVISGQRRILQILPGEEDQLVRKIRGGTAQPGYRAAKNGHQTLEQKLR
jgi:hypothetical protein